MVHFSGTKTKFDKLKALTHQEEKAKKSLLDTDTSGYGRSYKSPVYQAGMDWLQELLSQSPEERYAGLEAPYMRQFQEQIMPGIAEQFAGAGALGSSAFGNAAAGAGTDLMERLASLNINAQNQFRGQQMAALSPAMEYAQLPFRERMMRSQNQQSRYSTAFGAPSFAYREIPGQAGWGQGLMGGIGKSLGSSVGSGIGSMFGGLGSGIGGWLGGLFK